jgi:hypothetical protein
MGGVRSCFVIYIYIILFLFFFLFCFIAGKFSPLRHYHSGLFSDLYDWLAWLVTWVLAQRVAGFVIKPTRKNNLYRVFYIFSSFCAAVSWIRLYWKCIQSSRISLRCPRFNVTTTTVEFMLTPRKLCVFKCKVKQVSFQSTSYDSSLDSRGR